jgi:hypothetical protein
MRRNTAHRDQEELVVVDQAGVVGQVGEPERGLIERRSRGKGAEGAGAREGCNNDALGQETDAEVVVGQAFADLA